MRVVIALVALSLVVPSVGHAALSPAAAKCVAAKLKASGKTAQALLTCDSKAVGKGVAVDPLCIAKANDKLAKAFAKATDAGGCLTTDDGSAVAGLLLGSRNLVRADLVTSASASKCTAAKLKSAAKRAAALLGVHSKGFKKGSTESLAADVAKATLKFPSDFTKAEGKGDCHTTGDAAAVALQVDAGLDGVLARLAAIGSETVYIASGAEPVGTPGSGSTDASGYPKLVTQYGTAAVDLNQATYTRHFYQPDDAAPEAILILVPGFEGGAHSFKVLGENLVGRAIEQGTRLEVWAFDRRGHQLEDLVGQDIAEADYDAALLVDWYFGGELGLPLAPALPRRAVFHDPQADTPFIGNWTYNVIIRDIDAVVEAARAVVGDEVFLGGHSAGTGFISRYAATDFDLTAGVDAGHAKLRGLVLLEGGGASSTGSAPSATTLDRIEDRADGGLFAAIRDNAPRCVDGTPCTVANEAVDCAGKGRGRCIEPVTSYSIVAGLLNPRILAAGEITAMQAVTDPNGGENLVGADFGAPGNTPIAVVPDLSILSALGNGTALGGLGSFVDDDGAISGIASFVATSTGAAGPVVGGLTTWRPITEPPLPPAALPNNGPAPTALPAAKWGQEAEVTRMDRLVDTFFAGGTNFTDWYYPSSGLGVTSGLPALDSSALSVGRNRPDIDNVTEAANIDIPVICFGDSNGLTPVPANFIGFANSIGTCASGGCDGSTVRVVNPTVPNPAFPTYGDVAGGFEVHIIEGTAHVDVGTGEDNAENPLVGPLLAFIERNRG